jgi:hypothetical protein
MLSQLDSEFIDLTAVKRILVTGPAAPQQRDLSYRQTALHARVKKKVFKIKHNLWQSNLNFVKDVSMVYINVITIAVMVSEKTVTGFTFVPPIVLWPTVTTNQ